MKIQYASDLHLEFKENKAYMNDHPLQPAGDILILAGDVTPFALIDEQKDFFRFVSDNFESVYWLPGNHEYYGSDINEKSGVLHEKIESNVFLVNNVAIEKEEVRFLFSSLWSHISEGHRWQIEQDVSDFHAIRDQEGWFAPPKFNQIHQQALNFLRPEAGKKHNGKTIVVTHHVPTLLHYPPKHKGSPINEAFAVELCEFIEDAAIDYWIYGHHHTNTPAFTIGKTCLLTNQVGYVKHGEHHQFDGARLITL